jgi:hypothetical protein
MAVAGTHFRQDAIRAALKAAESEPPGILSNFGQFPELEQDVVGWITAVLVPEDNEHDAYAVAVYASGGDRIGYIDRHHSEGFREVLAQYVYPRGGEVGSCPAFIYEFPDHDLGARLCVSTPWYLLHNLDEDA